MLQDNIFTTVIQSCQLSTLPVNTKIYNKEDFSEIICVKLPDEFPRNLELMEIYHLESQEDLDLSDFVTRDENKPWIDIKNSILDMSIGQHTYRMTFGNLGTHLKATCWFSYIIQDNNPDKPYIYMKRDEGEADEQ